MTRPAASTWDGTLLLGTLLRGIVHAPYRDLSAHTLWALLLLRRPQLTSPWQLPAIKTAAAVQMAEIEDRWHHLPEGFHGAWKLIKVHIQAVAETMQVTSREELCWLAIAAATAWLPMSEPADAEPGRPALTG